jgi:hypothetical protein
VLEDFDTQKLQQVQQKLEQQLQQEQQQLAEASLEHYEKLSSILRAAAAQASLQVQQMQQLEYRVHPLLYLQSDDKVNEGCILRRVPNDAAAATFSKAAAELPYNFKLCVIALLAVRLSCRRCSQKQLAVYPAVVCRHRLASQGPCHCPICAY